MESTLQRFSYSLEGLRGFITLVDTFLKTRQDAFYEKKVEHLIPMVLAIQKLEPKLFEGAELLEEKAKKLYQGSFEISEVQEEQGNKTVSVHFSSEESEEKVFDALQEFSTAVHSKKMLYEGSLMTLTSSVEWFISRLIQTYYERYQDALGSKDKFFTLEDLKSFGSIEDARRFLIDVKVEELMRKSFSDWVKFLKETLALSLGYLKDEEELLVETFQRRHLIVHNGGVINAVYLSKVDKKLTNGIKLGDEVKLDMDYLMNRIDLFEQKCLLMGLEMWKKQDAADKRRADTILGIIRKHIKDRRWAIAEGLSFFLMNDKKMKERDRVMAQLYRWFSVKRQGRWSEIEDEVKSSDFSAKDKVLQLTDLAISDEIDSIFDMLENAIKGGEITCEQISKNPIFDEVRSDPRYEPILSKYSSQLKVGKIEGE